MLKGLERRRSTRRTQPVNVTVVSVSDVSEISLKRCPKCKVPKEADDFRVEEGAFARHCRHCTYDSNCLKEDGSLNFFLTFLRLEV